MRLSTLSTELSMPVLLSLSYCTHYHELGGLNNNLLFLIPGNWVPNQGAVHLLSGDS